MRRFQHLSDDELRDLLDTPDRNSEGFVDLSKLTPDQINLWVGFAVEALHRFAERSQNQKEMN